MNTTTAQKVITQLTKAFTPDQLLDIDFTQPIDAILDYPLTPELTMLIDQAQALNVKILPVQYASSEHGRIFHDAPITTTQGAFLVTYYEDIIEEDTDWTGNIIEGHPVTQTIICPNM